MLCTPHRANATFLRSHDSTLRTSEGYIYLLDFVPLYTVMLQYCWIWPTRVLRRDPNWADAESLTTLNRSSEAA